MKAFAWATERMRQQPQGIVAFVTNNGFLDGIAFDGMRRQLAEAFASLYFLDLRGNVRKHPKLSGTTHNVFGIQVGVSIAFLVKKPSLEPAKIYFARTGEDWRKEQKYEFLEQQRCYANIQWREIQPDSNHTWLTDGLSDDFTGFIPLGSKEQKASRQQSEGVMFKVFSNGVKTNRDAWTYHFNRDALVANIGRTIETYNEQVFKWNCLTIKPNVDDFVLYDNKKISWSSTLKIRLQGNNMANYDENNIRISLYRPFAKQWLYFDPFFADRRGQFPKIFPTIDIEQENKVICVTDKGSEKPFMTLMSTAIVDLHLVGAGSSTQAFPFYIYSEDGRHRQENLTDWALAAFREHYQDPTIDKWDIFYYVYGLLHNEDYRRQYAANLRRELPRIPCAPDFWAYRQAGKQLADWHVNYERQPEYPLTKTYTPDRPHDWKVQKMRLNRDKTAIVYNDWLTLGGIPPEAFAYRLGNRSALDWVIEHYQVKTDPRSGIVNDPNRPDDPQYIVRLLGQVVQVSVATVKIVQGLPALK